MKRILVIYPLARDRRELSRANNQYTIIFHDASTTVDITTQLKLLAEYIRQEKIDALMSTNDDIGTLLVSILAEQQGMIAPHPHIIAHQQHKYYARITHQQFVPHATPAFTLVDNQNTCSLAFPIFIKPVRGNFSCGSQEVHTHEELNHAYKNAYNHCHAHPWFTIAQPYLPTQLPSMVLAEQLCTGLQCTIEGFVYNHAITIIGITDSIMYPGTISFKQFNYPSALPIAVQEKIGAIATKLIQGIGFNNGFFNIECMYNPDTDTIFIIEVNPRMASQFADLYEKVEGFNSYEILLSIITNQEPAITFKRGKFARASSCVLRIFKDQRIANIPLADTLATIYQTYPDTRIELCGTVGQKLSELPQDGKSFRYALIHVGGQNQTEIEAKAAHIEQLMNIRLTDV